MTNRVLVSAACGSIAAIVATIVGGVIREIAQNPAIIPLAVGAGVAVFWAVFILDWLSERDEVAEPELDQEDL